MAKTSRLKVSGRLIDEVGIPSSPISAAGQDAAVTLTSSDNRFQFVTLTAARIYKLPNTGIKAGDTFTFINRATNDSYRLNLQASADTGTTYVDWIVNGKITVIALQDIPTAAAHWATTDAVSDWTSYTPSITSTYLTSVTGLDTQYIRQGSSCAIRLVVTLAYNNLGDSFGAVIPFPSGMTRSSQIFASFQRQLHSTVENTVAGYTEEQAQAIVVTPSLGGGIFRNASYRISTDTGFFKIAEWSMFN